jgi:hypothetical protein
MLLALGVPAEAIVAPGTSTSTYEDALAIHAQSARRDLDSVLLVTSAMHMPRALSAFEERNHLWGCYRRRDVVRCGVAVRFEGRSVTDGDVEIRVFVDNDAEPRLSPDGRVHCEGR